MSDAQKSHFSNMQKAALKSDILTSTLQLLEWDQETYMPKGAIDVRSSQIELLSDLIHKHKTSTSYKKALSKLVDLETGKPLDETASLAIKSAGKLWHKEWTQATKLPSSLIKQIAKNTSTSLHAWDLAKKNKDFSLFAPHLEKMVSLVRKKANFLGYKEHPYDALIDLYEPEMTVAKLSPLFLELKTALRSLLGKIEAARRPPFPALPKTFDPAIQMQMGKEILHLLGFSSETSRLDLTSHPFCLGIHPQDTRMTTRIFADNPLSNLLSVLHEAGHGLYNQQLPLQYYGTPLCQPLSFGVDESQSRLWETLIGKSLAFWEFFYPKLQQAFPLELQSIPLLEFYQRMNEVKASFIRVESDEVTYSLHIILRFEIEKALIEGTLKVQDVPSAWNAQMKDLLGIVPDNDSEGCLQDIHWSMGSFGYFPSYTLGNLLAAQLFDTLQLAYPDLENKIRQGNVLFIKDWLKENIHQHGKIYSREELILQVTKKPLSSSFYIEYLHRKFGSIYGF
jgi:carboxypeptidase Taq